MSFELPPLTKTVYMAKYLAKVRETGLHEAVRTAIQALDADVLRREISEFAPAEGLKALQGTGIRDEEAFVIPSLLRAAPATFTYYRLLLGHSRKGFYTKATGLSRFERLEDHNEIPEKLDSQIEDLCRAVNEEVAELFVALGAAPQPNLRGDVDQIPLLTLGAQADGAWRNDIGQKATIEVFEAMKQVVRNAGKEYEETEVSITVVNNSQREVTLTLAPDPDVVIREDHEGTTMYKAAIEIKGGSDRANIHNRVGEAEKSHLKARSERAQDFWTVIDLQNADREVVERQSPTTREWLDLNSIKNREGESWKRLVSLTITSMGI